MRRFDHEYVALKKLITEGELGNPLLVHCTHRNPAAGDHFNSEFMIRDSVVHEVDVIRFLLDEEITSVQVIKGLASSRAPSGVHDPMLVIFETDLGSGGDRRGVRPYGRGLRGQDRSGGGEGQCPDRPRPEPAGEDDRRPLGRTASLRASSSDSGRPTTPNCSAGSTPPAGERSTGRAPGTGTRRSRSARPVSRPCAAAKGSRVRMLDRPGIEPQAGIRTPDLEAARP